MMVSSLCETAKRRLPLVLDTLEGPDVVSMEVLGAVITTTVGPLVAVDSGIDAT